MKLGKKQPTKMLIINDVNSVVNIELRRIFYNSRFQFTGSMMLGNLNLINLNASRNEIR